jgi:hypothetical protein
MNDTRMEKNELLQLLCNFITAIGIDVIEGNVSNTTFLTGLEIKEGQLIFDRKHLLHPGDLLHEAGHIAVTSPAERKSLNGNVIIASPEKEGEELAVMLWTYAACIEMNFPPALIFHEQGYKGESEWILTSYKNKNYIGLPLLEWMGMTSASNFPVMDRWLRS